jgi:hypothetical protein
VKAYRSSFIRDLVVLLKKHPSYEWTRLADLLDDEKGRSGVVSFLKGIASSADAYQKKDQGSHKAKSKKPKRNNRPPQTESLERLELELSRNSLFQLRDLARKGGVEFSSKDSKKRLVALLLRHFSTKIAKTDIRLTSLRRQGPGDYVQWADIIWGGTRPKG